MQEEPKFPFVLIGAFYVRFEFRRKPELTEPLATSWTATIRVDDSKYPLFDVVVLAEASLDQPFSFAVEVVGRFNVGETLSVPDRSILGEFLSERALFMLWPYVVQAVAQASSQIMSDWVALPVFGS